MPWRCQGRAQIPANCTCRLPLSNSWAQYTANSSPVKSKLKLHSNYALPSIITVVQSFFLYDLATTKLPSPRSHHHSSETCFKAMHNLVQVDIRQLVRSGSSTVSTWTILTSPHCSPRSYVQYACSMARRIKAKLARQRAKMRGTARQSAACSHIHSNRKRVWFHIGNFTTEMRS